MSISRVGIVVVALSALASQSARADVTLADEYTQRLQIHQTIAPQGDSPFGEQVNPYSGSLSFRQSDVVFEGIGPTIRLVRGPISSASAQATATPSPAFGSWGLSIPRIETLVDGVYGWVIANTADPGRYARCTRFDRPVYFGTLNDPQAGWNGMAMITEDGNEQTILKRATQNTRKPAMTGANGNAIVFPAVTQDNWQIGCLPATSNGQAGEGFFVVSPDGTKYWFDYLLYATGYTVAEPDPVSGFILKQRRKVARMYATRIEDRFGNWVQYHYCNDQPTGCDGRVTSINASDGRNVGIAWRTDSPVISTVTMQPGTAPARIWQYQYTGITSTGAFLSALVLPDGSRWSFGTGAGGGDNSAHDPDTGKCTTRQKSNPDGAASTVTMTAPSGLVGSFTLAPVWHARNYVPSYCISPQHPGEEFEPYEQLPPLFKSSTLVGKEFTGPGIAPQSWSYTYAAAVGSTTSDACDDTSTCPTSTWVDVTDPEHNKTRYTYSNRWSESEGRLLRTDTYQGASTQLRTETYAHASPDAGPWPSMIGGSMMDWRSNTAPQSYWMPLQRKTTTQQGTTFTWAATHYDAFARPTTVQRDSAVSAMRIDATTYHDNQAGWVLGQVATASTGDIESARTDYNAQDLPWKTWAFGKLQQTLAYNANGTLATATDGNNHTTTLSNWYRGVPRLIRYPATPESPSGAAQSATVNAYGWITAVTNEIGATTSYDYDAMGQVDKITYPTDDTRSWHDTTMGFVRVGAMEYGIPAGHWRRTVANGYQRTVTYYDALWRPVLTREYDTNDVVATDRYVAMSYDPGGHPNYIAYAMAEAPTMDGGYWINGGTQGLLPLIDPDGPDDPDGGGTGGGDPDGGGTGGGDPGGGGTGGSAPTASTLPGVHTSYDALGRVTRVDQDSELGVLTTTTQYLNGFQTRTINPRQFVTTVTQYQAWDEPTTDRPVTIVAPEGATTQIARDVFGKPSWINRRNADGSLSQTRNYLYDAYQQLCKVMEPETGATLMGYDAAGNVTWSASGQPFSMPCDTGSVPPPAQFASAALRSYDARNRVTTLRFPDGLGDQDWHYTADGLAEQIVTWNGPAHTQAVSNAYAYNKRRLLTGESSTHADGNTWSAGYGFDASAHLASQTYPDGRTVQYAPNALGQATQVDSGGSNPDAWGASYYPNGALKSFVYGNGIVHTMTQNARGLPERSMDAYGTTKFVDDTYDYDGNGNVAAISDGATGRNQRGNRDMSYDGLDRLTDVVSPMYGSTGAHFGYDALDNITHVTAPGRNHAYCYYGNNQLKNIQQGDCQGATLGAFDYDAQGNVTNKSGNGYVFDHGNRLRSASYAGAETEAYQYDGLGRRVQATAPAGTIGSFYSQGGQLLYQDNGRDGQTHSYFYLAGSMVNELTRNTATGTYANRYQHTDALGSPVVVTNGPRAVLQRSEFEPYGKLVNRPLADGPGYAGHVSDAATALSYMQQRYYDPVIGRFLSVDPVTVDGDTGASFNRYWYAVDNPYKFTDPDGRQPCSDACMGMRATSDGFGGVQSSFRSPQDFGAILTREKNYSAKPGVSMSEKVESQVSNVADNYYSETGKKLVVTDGSRTAADQASRMYYKITHGEGVRIYANRKAANAVMGAYNNSAAAGQNRADILAAMSNVIANQMSQGIFISAHLNEGAVDFRNKDMSASDRSAFRSAADSYKVIQEGVPPHFHVEF